MAYLGAKVWRKSAVSSSVCLPQLLEMNTSRLMDVAGECLLYDEFMIRVNHGYMADSRIHTIHLGEEHD
jgi:hypothetical protein